MAARRRLAQLDAHVSTTATVISPATELAEAVTAIALLARLLGGMFLGHSAGRLCANKAVFAGRRGMLPPADPTHSGLMP